MIPPQDATVKGTGDAQPRVPSSRAAATCAAAIGAGAIGGGCIAVHWTGADGVDRHLGAVMCTEEAMLSRRFIGGSSQPDTRAS